MKSPALGWFQLPKFGLEYINNACQILSLGALIAISVHSRRSASSRLSCDDMQHQSSSPLTIRIPPSQSSSALARTRSTTSTHLTDEDEEDLATRELQNNPMGPRDEVAQNMRLNAVVARTAHRRTRTQLLIRVRWLTGWQYVDPRGFNIVPGSL